MTINEITNCVDLMSRSTKERIELFANNKHDESNFANQLPSIIISSSTKRANENSTVTVVDELHHSSTGASISTPRHLSASSQKPSKTQIVVLNNQANSAGKRHSKMEPLPNFQTQATVQVHLDGMPLPLPHNQTRCIEGRHHDSDTLNCTEADQRSIISRPTTLASASSSLSAAKPPEFSISPAESLSLSKASSNEQMSSSVFHLPSVYKGPHSPSNLSVNFCKWPVSEFSTELPLNDTFPWQVTTAPIWLLAHLLLPFTVMLPDLSMIWQLKPNNWNELFDTMTLNLLCEC